MKPTFAPWLQPLKQAAAWAVGSLIVGAVALRFDAPWIALAAIVVGVAVAHLRHKEASRRRWGLVREKSAIDELRRVAPQAWQLAVDLQSPSVGNIDLLVFGPRETLAVIDIKAFRGLKPVLDGVKKASDGKDVSYVLDQVLKQCDVLEKGQPVVWCPDTDKERVFTIYRRARPVVVVCGNARKLVSVLSDTVLRA